jgi:hypothetical protein
VDILITLGEIAQYSRFSEAKVLVLQATYNFPMQKAGKHWVSSKKAIDEWLENLITAQNIPDKY